MKFLTTENRNKKIILVSVISVAFILITTLFLIDFIKNSKITKAKRGIAIASVNGFTIYEGDLSPRLDTLSPDKKININELPENILKAMILEVTVNHKIDQDAKKLKYNKDPQILELTKKYEQNLMRDKYLNENIYSKITEQDLLSEYNKLSNNLKGKEERKIKHILVKDENEIKRIRRNVLRSGKFEKIAKEKSIDTASGQNGGDIGYVLKEELVPEFGDMAFILKIGEISKPVHTKYGWHIIKVEDAREAQFLPFEQVKENIRKKLQQEAVQKYLTTITEDSDVEFKIELKQPKSLQAPVNEENKTKNTEN